MSEIIIDGVDDLYEKINGKIIDPIAYGPLAAFYAKMAIMKDPNACSCKKGKKAQMEIQAMYMSMPPAIRMEPLRSAAAQLVGEGTLVFKLNGNEFARIG
jgi:hypothetical protein